MSTIGISATKDHLYLALTTSSKSDFTVLQHHRIALDPNSWPTVMADLRTHLDSYNSEDPIEGIGLVCCATGRFGASPEAFKAEGIAEMRCQESGYTINRVAKQSLKRRLDCEKEQKWQDVARDLFNPDRAIQHFSSGFDAAISGAYASLQ